MKLSQPKIKLTEAPRLLREHLPQDRLPPTYRVLYGRVLDGSIPAEQINGRWFLDRADLAHIAKMFCA